jgi:hypothetical protein
MRYTAGTFPLPHCAMPDSRIVEEYEGPGEDPHLDLYQLVLVYE